MNVVSQQELLQIQQDVSQAACDKPCVISRPSTTKDAYGSDAVTYNPISPPDQMVGMTEPTAGQLTNYAYIVGDLATYQLKFPIGTDVQTLDHVTVEGQTIIVQVILTPRSFPTLITCLATEIKQKK